MDNVKCFPKTIGVQWRTDLLDLRCPMEYKGIVQTVVETPTYLAVANKLFSEEERADIIALVAADPECGDVIRGTDSAKSASHAKEWERAEVPALYISGETKLCQFFSSRFFQKMRKRTYPWQNATP